MRFGLQLHGSLPADSYGPLAARAESLGFGDVTVHDVLLRRPVWPLLQTIASATRTALIGPNVTHPYLQHPVVIAANAAHLDEVSAGRLILGLGRGSMYELVGQRLPSGVGGLASATNLVRALLNGDRSGIGDEHFRLAAGAGLDFGTRRDVPIHYGVFGERGVRLAGRLADGVRAAGQWDPDYGLQIRRWLDESATDAGRDPDSLELTVENWTCIHPDRAVARRAARRILAPFLPHLGAVLTYYRVPATEVAAARAAASGDIDALTVISDTTVDRFMAAGDADDLKRGVERLRQAGLTNISFSGVLGPDPDLAMTMLGDEVASATGRP